MGAREAVCICIDRIYDAATQGHWREVLRTVSEATGSTGGGFFIHRERSGEILAFESLNLYPDKVREYEEHYVFHDPRIAYAARPDSPAIIHDYMHISEREMRRNEYYDWIRTTGYKYYVATQVALDADVALYCGPQRTAREGPVTDEQLAMFSLLVPHMRRAVNIHRQIAAGEAHAALNRELINRRPDAIFLCSRDRRVVYLNSAADSLLSPGNAIILRRGRLQLHDARDQRALGVLMRSCAEAQVRPDKPAGGEFLLRSRNGSAPLLCRVSPLHGSDSPFVDENARPGMMVVIAALDTDAEPDDTSALRRLYGLTAREAEVAARLAGGMTVAEAADDMGITNGTARGYLKSLLRKTDSRNQQALIRLMGILRSTR